MRAQLPPKLCCHLPMKDLAAALQRILQFAIWLSGRCCCPGLRYRRYVASSAFVPRHTTQSKLWLSWVLLLSKTVLPPNLLYLQLLTHSRPLATTMSSVCRIDSAAGMCPRSKRQEPRAFRIFACSGARLAGGLRN